MEHDMEVDAEEPSTAAEASFLSCLCIRPKLEVFQQHSRPAGDVYEQLSQITTSVTQLHKYIIEQQRITDARLVALDQFIRGLSTTGDRNGQRDTPFRGSSPTDKPKKDSSANYIRVSMNGPICIDSLRLSSKYQRCIRKHIKLTFGFNRTDSMPDVPSAEGIRKVLGRVERGESLSKPYRFDWTSAPSSVYNLCIENYFSTDFWASVEAGEYDLTLIPAIYQRRDNFIKLYRRHLAHLRKCWTTQQNPPQESHKLAKAKHYARNSRIGTVGRYRLESY